MTIDPGIFERHLDVSLLRGRRRGLIRCPFHGTDRRPSFSVDLDRAVFHCFGCGVEGGVKRLAELLGAAAPDRPRPDWIISDYETAIRNGLRREHAAAARRAEWWPLWHCSDHVRRCARLARDARRLGTGLGLGDPRTWPLLERAAVVEREGLRVEAELDAILAEGRLA